MKKITLHITFMLTMLLALTLNSEAQNTSGTEFWLTFGRNSNHIAHDEVDLQVRIVSGDESVKGTIHFTKLGTSIPFEIGELQVYTYIHHQNPFILGQYVHISHWQIMLDTCSKQTSKSVMIM